jgi:hypothetical protein
VGLQNAKMMENLFKEITKDFPKIEKDTNIQV